MKDWCYSKCTCTCSCIWILYGAAYFKLKLYFSIPLQSYRYISEFSFDTCRDFRWISLVDILDFNQRTRMKFQSVSNCAIISAVWRAISYACNHVFCKEWVSTAQVAANTSVESNSVSRSILNPSVILRLIPCVAEASFYEVFWYYFWQLVNVYSTSNGVVNINICLLSLAYYTVVVIAVFTWVICICTIVQLASPAIHNKDNRHIF